MPADTPGSPHNGPQQSAVRGVGSAARRVGLFGGTFDPVHHGHLAAAWNVRQLLDLDEVWLVVANDPWQKSDGRVITPASQRLSWVQAAVADVDGLDASAIEIELGGASYTIDTLAALRQRHADVAWSVIVGADVVDDLDSWHRADELKHQTDIVAVDRPGSDVADAADGWTVHHVTIPPIDLSSTQLRELSAAGRQLHFLVPNAVADDIAASGVYELAAGQA